jgi:hypothetical protein
LHTAWQRTLVTQELYPLEEKEHEPAILPLYFTYTQIVLLLYAINFVVLGTFTHFIYFIIDFNQKDSLEVCPSL